MLSYICESGKYFIEIVNNIKENLYLSQDGNRAVIIFFQNQQKLEEFYQHPSFEFLKHDTQILNEKLTDKEKQRLIQIATYSGKVTLATRSFGRGTDFICRDPEVEARGGIHIILTFLPELESELVQIKGRTARQGNKGSFTMKLYQQDLSAYDLQPSDFEKTSIENILTVLRFKRDKKMAELQKDDTQSLIKLNKQHIDSEIFKYKLLEMSQLQQQNEERKKELLDFLMKLNKGPSIYCQIKTLVLIDATGSMSGVINKTKNCVHDMYQRAGIILSEKGLDPDQILIKIACYRSYNAPLPLLIEYSTWEQKPQSLRNFLDRVQAAYGQGNESVECGLQFANYEATYHGDITLSQVFLIGDSGSTDKNDVPTYFRVYNCKSKYSGTIYANQTNWEIESNKLKDKGVPIYSFHVHPRAADNFSKISQITGGKNQYLDVNSDDGQKLLVDQFVPLILDKIGQFKGGKKLADELVDAYKKRYA